MEEMLSKIFSGASGNIPVQIYSRQPRVPCTLVLFLKQHIRWKHLSLIHSLSESLPIVPDIWAAAGYYFKCGRTYYWIAVICESPTTWHFFETLVEQAHFLKSRRMRSQQYSSINIVVSTKILHIYIFVLPKLPFHPSSIIHLQDHLLESDAVVIFKADFITPINTGVSLEAMIASPAKLG